MNSLLRNLLNEGKFEVSANQYDTILMLNSSEYGVWLSIRGSSILHLYDKSSYSCKLMYNIRTSEYLNIEKVKNTLNKSKLPKNFGVKINPVSVTFKEKR